MQLKAINFHSKRDVMHFIFNLQDKGLVKLVTKKINDQEKPVGLVKGNEILLQDNLIFADTGQTYLLAEIAQLKIEEIKQNQILQQISFVTKNNTKLSLIEVKIAIDKNNLPLLTVLLRNKPLVEALLSLDIRKMTMAHIKCPIGKHPVLDPCITLKEDTFEDVAIVRWLTTHQNHPLDPSIILNLSSIFRNHALKELISVTNNLALIKLHRLQDANNDKFAGRIGQLQQNFVEMEKILHAKLIDLKDRNKQIAKVKADYNEIIQQNPALDVSSNDLDNLQLIIRQEQILHKKIRLYSGGTAAPVSKHALRAMAAMILAFIVLFVLQFASFFNAFVFSYGYAAPVLITLLGGVILDYFNDRKLNILNEKNENIEKIKLHFTTENDPVVRAELAENLEMISRTERYIQKISLKPKPPKNKVQESKLLIAVDESTPLTIPGKHYGFLAHKVEKSAETLELPMQNVSSNSL